MSNLLLRIISALILIPVVVISVLFLPINVFSWALAGVLVLGLIEWGKMTHLNRWVIALGCVSMGGGIVVLTYQSNFLIWLSGVTSIFWIVQMIMLRCFKPQGQLHWLHFICGIIVLLACWSGVMVLSQLDDGRLMMIALLLVVWSADSFAYFAGKRWGNKQLAPAISPGKTVEGVIGGLVGAVLVSMCFFYFFMPELNTFFLLIISVAAIIASVVGDLYQSSLKRRAGMKDSGNIIPGHGGVLDRIDGLVAAAPVFATMGWLLL